MTKIYENKIKIQTFEKNKLYKKEFPRKKSKSPRHSNQSLSPNQKIKEKYLVGKGGKKLDLIIIILNININLIT